MRDILYQELYKQNKTIRDLETIWNQERIEEGRNCLVDAILKVKELGILAREEGLLALDDAAAQLDNQQSYQQLKRMVLLVVDGTDPEIVEELCTTKYFSAGYEGHEALQYLIFMFGMLSIQKGEYPCIIEQELLTLVPESVIELYDKKVKEVEEKKHQPEETELSVMEKYYEGDIAVEYGDDAYFLIKIVDYIIKEMDDKSIQRLLRDIDNNDVALLMRGLSGEARKRIWGNMSTRLGIMIAEDMDFMGAIRVKNVAGATYKVLALITKMISYGEIKTGNNELITAFAKIIGIRKLDENKKTELITAESDLQNCFNEYMKQSNRILYPPK